MIIHQRYYEHFKCVRSPKTLENVPLLVACDDASETPFTKLIFHFLNVFLRKQNNTHEYFRNSRLHFTYIEQ